MNGGEPSATPRDIDFIRGEPGLGVHCLFVGLNIALGSGGRGQEAILVASSGDAFVQGVYLGPLRPVGEPRVVSRNGHVEARVCFKLDLSRAQLEALEQVRQGQDFVLAVKTGWRLIWGDPPQEKHTELSEWKRSVTASDWAVLRRDMGVGRTLLLETPVPNTNEYPELADAVARWEEAHADWVHGRTRDAVAKCRQAFEAIPAGPTPNANREARSKEERIEDVRRSLRAVCHPAAHMDAVSRSIVWERAHAEFLLSACAALLALYTRCPWAPDPVDPAAMPP